MGAATGGKGGRGTALRRLAPAVLAGAGASLAAFVLYVSTLGPTVLPYVLPALPDTPMLQMQVCVLGNTHPTGYPTYLMLSHGVTYLPFGDCGYRANLASAIYGALATAAVFAAGYLLCRRVPAAVVGALALALGSTFWSQAVIAEVYTLNALFVALTLVALFAWRSTGRDRYLLLAALGVGLCVTNHMTSALLLPGGLLFVWLVDRGRLLDVRLLLKAAGLFAVGLLPYLYLPVRSLMGAPMDPNRPDNLERFLYVVSGGNLRGGFFAFGPAELPERFLLYARFLLENFGWVTVTLGLVGFAALIIWDRQAAAFTGFLYGGWLFHAIENNIVDVDLYFIPTYVIFALWVARGAALLLEEAEALRPRARGVALAALSGLLILVPLWAVPQTYGEVDASGDYRARATIENVVEKVPRGATILHHRTPLWYMVLVEERRRDLTLVDPFYDHEGDIQYADIVWPTNGSLEKLDRIHGTADSSGVEAATVAAERGPVYLITNQDVSYVPFLDADFRVQPLGRNLYKLTPPDGVSEREA